MVCAAPAAGLLRPLVDVYQPAAGSLEVLRDLRVAARDGTALRVNVVLPPGDGRFPVLMSAHPYGKDNLPARRGRRWRVSAQYRILRQTSRVRFSSLTGWEAPDPAWWAAQGYAVVNCDLRGAGTSEGEASLFSDQEADDVCDLIEWAAAQPWSTGAVGLIGVSYLAISQWKAAARQPPHLKAICPWEGFTDAYRDCFTRAVSPADGFTRLWSLALRKVRQSRRLTGQQRPAPAARCVVAGTGPGPEKGRGAGAGVRQLLRQQPAQPRLVPRLRSTSPARRSSSTPTGAASGPSSTLRKPGPRSLRSSTGTCAGRDIPAPPRVRLEVRESRDVVTASGTRTTGRWNAPECTPLYRDRHRARRRTAVSGRPDHLCHALTGRWLGLGRPRGHRGDRADGLAAMGRSRDADDLNLFAGVEKWRGNTYVPFEGSYGSAATGSAPAG